MVAMDILEELEKVPQQPEDLASCDLLGFDTETTGLGPGSSIISASLVLRDRKSGEDKVENFLLNPHAPIDPGAAAVNGFTQEFVEKNGGDQKEGLEKMAKAIILAQLKGIPLVAYNAKFDVSMLKSDLEKVGRGDLAEKLSRLSVLDPLVFDRALSTREMLSVYSADSSANSPIRSYSSLPVTLIRTMVPLIYSFSVSTKTYPSTSGASI